MASADRRVDSPNHVVASAASGSGSPDKSGDVAIGEDVDTGRLAEIERGLAHSRANVVATLVNYFLRPRWWVELAVIAGLYAGYSAIRNSVGEVTSVAFGNARAILHFEDSLGIAYERALNEFVHHTPIVAVPSALEYASLHFIVTPAVLIWLFVSHRHRYRLCSAVLIITTLLALIGFYLAPTAPPRMLGSHGFFDIMSETSSWGWWPQSGAPGSDAISNQFAAMPSLHCAWSTWCGVVIVVVARRTWLRVLGMLYPLSTYFVVMGTGNHYFLDVVAGVGTLAVGAAITFGICYAWRYYVAWSRLRLVAAT